MSQTNTQLLADSLGTASTGTIPIGGIILWSGSTESIPNGWALCNGFNGTTNLQDRFVVGAGSGYTVNATGGSADAVVVQHNHSYSNFSNPGNHTHTYDRSDAGAGTEGGNQGVHDFNSSTSTGGGGSHTHSFDIDNEGVSGTNKNLPPYYALAYIMRTS